MTCKADRVTEPDYQSSGQIRTSLGSQGRACTHPKEPSLPFILNTVISYIWSIAQYTVIYKQVDLTFPQHSISLYANRHLLHIPQVTFQKASWLLKWHEYSVVITGGFARLATFMLFLKSLLGCCTPLLALSLTICWKIGLSLCVSGLIKCQVVLLGITKIHQAPRHFLPMK